MMEAIESFKVGEYRVRIYHDETPESPREWDNLGTMVCWHRRYNLGDVQLKDEYNGDIQLLRETLEGKDVALYLPLFLYDHSGITMSTGSFGDPWDSGQVGYIYVTRETMRKEYGKRITAKRLERAELVLRGEVETYDQFLTGQVYGYEVKGPDGELADSCWGFYGLEYTIEEATAAAENAEKHEQKEAANIAAVMAL